MMRLVFSDLRDHAATWIGAFLVAVGCGYIGGWAVSILTTTETYRNLETLVWTMVAFSSFAAAVVLVSAANLTVSAQRRSYALWQIANVSPRSVSAVVLAQLAVVATLGAACGTLVESVTYAPLFPWVFSSPFYQPIDQVVLEVGASRMPTVWLAVAAVSLVGGLKGARSAGETPPLEALRDSEPKRRGMTWLRAILFASLATGTCALSVFMVEAQSYAALSNALFVPLLAVATLATVAPVVLSALMRAWTSIMPQLRWNAWYLARHTARYGLSLSASVETPIMVGFGLVAGIASLSNMLAFYAQQQNLLDYKTSLDFTSSLLMLGGPVLLCAIGAAVSVVMTSKSRTRDVALLIAGGARPRTLLAAARARPSSMPSRQRWRAWRPWPSPTSSPRTLSACRCSTGWLSERVWPSRSRASSSSSPRRSCPRSPPFAKSLQPSSRWGSESRDVSGLVFGGRFGRLATESAQQRKGQGGRECTLCMICRRFPL